MKRNNLGRLAAALTLLIFVTLACGTGYTTTTKRVGRKGQIIVRADEADGEYNTSIEIDEDLSWDLVTLTVNVKVTAGSYHAEFVGEEGGRLILDASPNNPGQGSVQLETDAFGEIDLEAQAQGAEDVEITLDYTLP